MHLKSWIECWWILDIKLNCVCLLAKNGSMVQIVCVCVANAENHTITIATTIGAKRSAQTHVHQNLYSGRLHSLCCRKWCVLCLLEAACDKNQQHRKCYIVNNLWTDWRKIKRIKWKSRRVARGQTRTLQNTHVHRCCNCGKLSVILIETKWWILISQKSPSTCLRAGIFSVRFKSDFCDGIVLNAKGSLIVDQMVNYEEWSLSSKRCTVSWLNSL